MSPTVGVVICAYTLDRFDDIERAVQSLQQQEPQPDEVLLVIDHNEQLFERATARWSEGVQILRSTGPKGLSGARNSGIDACTADIVAFLDDDAAAAPGWLADLTEPFADSTVAVTGGRAIPVWPTGQAPATLPPELLWIVGCTYLGQPTVTSEVRNVMGCAMAFRAKVLAEVGGFVDGVGRTAELPLGCEETEICIRTTQHDPAARIVFVPSAVVHHRVSPDRLTWRYLRRRCYAEGISKAAISRLVGATDALSSEAAYTRSVLPRGIVRELRHGRPQSAAAIVTAVFMAAVGYIRGRITGR